MLHKFLNGKKDSKSVNATKEGLGQFRRVKQASTLDSLPNSYSSLFYNPFLDMGSRISAVKRNDHNDNRQGVYKSLDRKSVV